MLSFADMAVLGTAALLFFGPEKLPKVARRAGFVIREIQGTSQAFVRQMEQAATLSDEELATIRARYHRGGGGSQAAPQGDEARDTVTTHPPAPSDHTAHVPLND